MPGRRAAAGLMRPATTGLTSTALRSTDRVNGSEVRARGHRLGRAGLRTARPRPLLTNLEIDGAGRNGGGFRREPLGWAAGPRAKRRRWLPRTVRHLAELLLVGFIVEYFVVPQIGGTHKALHVLASVNPFLPVLGVLLEVLSLIGVLRADPEPHPEEL